MKRTRRAVSLTLALLFCSFLALAQQPLASPTANTRVPAVVRFNGIAVDAEGKVLSGAVDMTFSIYKEEQGGAALWMEAQSVNLDANGHYAVLLGAATPSGLPLDAFASGEARWIGVRVQGQAESPRVVLLSVPYALKAADAETIGGLPPTAFALATPSSGGNHQDGPGTRQTSVPAATVTSVGLAAPSTDYSVSGSPVTTSGTLTFSWKVSPTNLNTANAIVKRDASGNFSAGTITATAVKGGTLSGNGAAVTNVNAASLGGFAAGSYAHLAAADTFTQPLAVKAAAAKTALLTVAGTGTGAGSLTVDGFGDLSLSPGTSATPQNLVTGVAGLLTSVGAWSNFSAINLIPGFALFPIPTTRTVFYIGFTGGSTAVINNMVLYHTTRAGYKITAVTPVKFKGVSNPTISLTSTANCPVQPVSTVNPCIVRLDPVSVTLSPVNDYYFVIFFPTNSNNGPLLAATRCGGCGNNLFGGYVSGDASRHTVGQSVPSSVATTSTYFIMGVMTN